MNASLLPPRRFVSASAEEARDSEQVPAVVPGSVVVNFVEIEIAAKQGNHEDERCNESMPQTQPEPRGCAVINGGPFQLVCARRASIESD